MKKNNFFIISTAFLLITSCISMNMGMHKSVPESGRPFGTVELKMPDSLSSDLKKIYAIDDTEITIQEWTHYLLLIGSKDLSEISEKNTDFKNYLDLIYNESLNEYDITDNSFLGSIPITHISYSQAYHFCKWRTEQDSLYSIEKSQSSYFKYSLPSSEFYEWIIPVLTADSINKKGVCPNFNFKGVSNSYPECGSKASNNEYRDFLISRLGRNTIGMASFYSNKFQIYDICGNASEMTNQIGISKGGSFNNRMSECDKGQDISYFSSEPWLGFRCVVEIEKM